MIYVILGPTGSGKTGQAAKLFPHLNDPIIINADAFQIYKDMNIGTAKISKDDPLYSHYRLLDFVSPDETYSVRDYQRDFRKIVDDQIKNDKDIIVCGGTGLYVRAALYDYDFVEYNDENDVDMSSYECLDNDTLHKKLEELDFDESLKLHKNNRKRVLQAIKICLLSNNKKSELIEKQEHKLIYPNVKILCIDMPRDELYEHINNRVDKMIENGLVDEVKMLLKRYDLSQTARQAIGYKEIISYLNNEISLDDAIELIKKRTRNYAKRQITFFKHQFSCIIFYDKNELLRLI